MRISTESMFQSNTSNIDNLYSQYQQQGQELSTGISVNVPSDDPQQIAQDLSVRADNSVETQVGTNLGDLSNQLTSVDGALSSLTNILQSARSLTIEGASDTTNDSQRQNMATQIQQMLQEVVGLANTQYAGKYVFAGTQVPTGGSLVTASGSPTNLVASSSNEVQQVQQLPDGQEIPTGVTLQQGFNYNSPDGSPDVFQTLINIYNTMQNGAVADQSATAVNVAGTYINTNAASPPGTTLAALTGTGAAAVLSTPLQMVAGSVTFNVANQENPSGVNITLPPPGPPPPPANFNVNQAVASINAQLAAGGINGITASFNQATQKMAFTSTTVPAESFTMTDVSGNFTQAFGLTQTADTTTYLSTQLGDIDNVLQQALNAQAQVGATVQTVNSTNQTTSSRVLNDTAVQSGIEDTDIAKVTSQFTQTQTVLQAAYATTTRLESKTLFDYLS